MVGSELVTQALAQGRQIAVLARDLGPLPASSRFPDEVRVLRGDVRQPGLGVGESDLSWLRQHCDRVLHLAARVSFQAEPRTGEPYLTNFDGTRHLLRLCRTLGIRRLGYVSTAYVCGDGDGPIGESDLEAGQSFHNDYERSKFMAETLLARATDLEYATVFRPSVVVGDWHTGATSAFHGIYSVLQAAWHFDPALRLGILEQAGIDPDCEINLVPVDWVAATIWRICDSENLGHTVHHLTHPQPVPLRRLVEALEELGIGSSRLTHVDPVALDSVLRPLRGYLRNHPRFESKIPSTPPAMDPPALTRLCRYAVANNFRSHRPGLDVKRLLAALPAGDSQPTLRLEFEDGASAHLAPSEQGLCLVPEGPATAVAFAQRAVFDQLLTRRLDLNGALFAGSLVLEAEPETMPEAVAQLSRLVEHLGGAS